MVIVDKDDVTDPMPWSVDGLIEVAERIMAAAPEVIPQTHPKNKKELNVRLIRDYVVRGFIPRPARSGREVRFGLDHLVHLLTVRALLRNQKWSLPAIKASFAATSSAELLDRVLAPVRSRIHAEYQKAVKAAGLERLTPSKRDQLSSLNPAQLLIQRFKSGDGPSKREQGSAAQSVSFGVAARLVQANSGTTSSGRSKLHIELEPWCEVVVDLAQLQSLTPGTIERLAEALKRRLKDETAR
jgi:hypothetical protein